MTDIHRDPATGRPYLIDEQGMPRWADEPAPPEPEPFARLASQPAHSRAAVAPAKRRGLLLPVLAAAATGLVGLAVGYGIGAAGTTSTGTTSTKASPAAAASVPDDGPGTAQPEAATVSASNYTAELKTLSKQCFGSAGCSVEVRVELGVDSVARDIDAEVIVTITGDESGPITQTMVVQSGQYDAAEVSLSTPSSKTKISVKVTSAEAL